MKEKQLANDNMKYIAVVVVIAVFVVGLGAGMFLNSGTGTTTSEPYHLNLVITDNNEFNSSVGSQPAYFVLQNGALVSSAQIHVPVNKKVEVTISNYDDGADPVNDTSLGQVKGTVNNTMLVVTDEVGLATQDANGQEIHADAQYVSSVGLDNISHTFTVEDPNNGYAVVMNIPIEPSSTVTFMAIFSTKGTFHWQCFIPCGSGPSGWDASMSTPGWMTGDLIVG